MTLKVILLLAASLAITHSSEPGQVYEYPPGGWGQVWFANRSPENGLDAPVFICDNYGLGPYWTAQLYLHGTNGLIPLKPAATFREVRTNLIGDRYWLGTTVDVPGFLPGQPATFSVRVYPTGKDWDEAIFRGQSAPVTVILGGGLKPPSILVGLQTFTISIECGPLPNLSIIGLAGTPVTLGMEVNSLPFGDLIAVSSDLKTWRPYLNVFSKVFAVNISAPATVDALQPHLFYRTRWTYRDSNSQLRAEWQKAGITNYTYKFKRTCSCPIVNLSGTVTVQNGKPVSVDAYNDGQPIEMPDLSQFKTISDLFDLVESEQPKAEVFTVGYDPVYRFPTVIDINYVVNAADDEIQYWATDVRPF